MKLPKYCIGSMQQAIDLGINAFAFQLLSESFSDKMEKFGDDSVIIISKDNENRQVFFIMTKEQPTMADFGVHPDTERLDKLGQYMKRGGVFGNAHGAHYLPLASNVRKIIDELELKGEEDV